jgi:transcriptional regulator with XRE-family HTH domain
LQSTSDAHADVDRRVSEPARVNPRNMRPDFDRQLAVFLRERRRGIDRNIRFLGDSPRQRTRWGMLVTQEEIAEALGVSRVWYASFESSPRVRVSIKLIDRVATVLMLDEWERVALLGMALPELRQAFADLFSQSPNTLPPRDSRSMNATGIVGVLESIARWLNELPDA